MVGEVKQEILTSVYTLYRFASSCCLEKKKKNLISNGKVFFFFFFYFIIIKILVYKVCRCLCFFFPLVTSAGLVL